MRHSPTSKWYYLVLILFALTPVLSACTSATQAVATETPGVPLPEAVETYMADLPGPEPKLFLTTRVYDRQGTLLGEFWDEGRRYWVSLDRIAPAVRQAIIATEDKTFYSNPGVDWTAIARAVMQNSTSGDVVSGASTITQQLARNIAMPFNKRTEQSIDRKISETVLAQDLTQRFSKDQILEMYLNVVYYGHFAYGIEAAARTYFAKTAADLTLAESAMLAAMPQSPAALDPLVPDNQERAKERQGLVLALMAKNGFIKPDEAERAYAEPLQYRSEQVPRLVPHFMQYLFDYLAGLYGKDMVNRGGLTIMSSLDLPLQQKAETIVRKQVDAVRNRYNLTNAALLALRPGTGEVLAMVGSADFDNAAINGQVNVTISRRQPGSAIKPVLYSLAFTHGKTPGDVIADTPVSFPLKYGQIYSPVNYDGRYHGTVRLRTALANSYNIPAVKLLNELGVPEMVAMAKAFGIQSLDKPPETYGLALTLGGSEVTPMELTGVFAAFANGGISVPPTPIRSLADSTGHTILHFGPSPKPAVDPRVAYMITSILSDNEARVPMFGTNSPLKLSRPVAAKTGTTNDWRDNWTVGYTPYLAVGVWAGNSNGQPMRNTTGLTGAAPIFHDFMEAVFSDPTLDRAVRDPKEPIEFRRPPGLIDVPVCDVPTAKIGSCKSSRTDLAIDPSVPITIGVTSEVVSASPTPDTATPAATIEITSTVPMSATVAHAEIEAPYPGSTINGPFEIIGTVTFDQMEYQFYKVEYAAAANPDGWTTIGDVHAAPVSNSTIETWHAESLPNGNYLMRVVLIKHDGNYVTSNPISVTVQH